MLCWAKEVPEQVVTHCLWSGPWPVSLFPGYVSVVNQFTAGHLPLTQVTLVKLESLLARTGVCEELGGWGGLALALEPGLLTFCVFLLGGRQGRCES